jgi:enamine deaminase RidA (YjgF/YER057c/UK114 family)
LLLGRSQNGADASHPWPWSLSFGFNQAEIIEGRRRELICVGQADMDANGKPQHAGDMRGQIGMALDNLEAVLTGAGMIFANIVRLRIYTTDVDEALADWEVMGTRLGRAGVTPPMTLLGVTRLAFPELMIELEATAVD